MKGDKIMLNKEKYAKEIIEIACNGDAIGMRNRALCPCSTINDCYNQCDFYSKNIPCEQVIKDWANSEYKELEIDQDKVPVDTPIYVWENGDSDIYKRYFARYDKKII